MLLDSDIFPDLVDAIVRSADLEGLCAWRAVSRYHRSVADGVIFPHVHLYERAAYTVEGVASGGWAMCAQGVRWPFWAWERGGAPTTKPLLPPPFKHTRVLDISWQGPRSERESEPVPASILDLFEPRVVRLVAFRGAYPALRWRWPQARLISFVDVSTTKQRGGRDARAPGPETSTVLHLRYDARRNEFFRLLALSYVFPTFAATHDVTLIISPDRPGPESLRDRRKTTAQVLKRVGYWIRYGKEEEEWEGAEEDEYRITVVVDGLTDLDELADEPRASAVRAAGEDAKVPLMPVTFVTHDEYRARLGSEDTLHYDWPRQPGERVSRRGSETLWVL
ncbi:hypothetical protein CC85DRAFT_9236 [Cutaneotrichosporon oleaginosum]|uniref:Uncharacterized protein n=1 Tax=Cutaneotrichosporon oleaginosum TaxID=879819 RepID=A0A0J1B9Q1_9TREE|nr:uncharacterized protein CC85DRAFT_9236 [Cutaneotrichosporon oleaginosum]KLT44579.1 hypothetical protein CC85DRAFT_9236 [Cutaneotrichosporon oleaginosum]TXT13907.1 hypothetical protein COLE_00100 [Cutaneotrichosporon oleaginosum]